MKIIINSGGKNQGPFTWQQVIDLLREKVISENDFAWVENGNEWTSVSDVLARVRPPVSLTSRLNRNAEKPDPRRQTNLLQLRSKRSSPLARPLY